MQIKQHTMKTYKYTISACALALALSLFTPSELMAQKRKVTRKGVQTSQSAKTTSKTNKKENKAEESKSKDEMNQTLVVEREYAPVERDANKIERTPAAEQPMVTRSVVTYADWKANTAIDTLVTKLPVGQVFDDETVNTHRGYVDANLGNYWNTNIDAGYRVIEEEEITVLVNGGFHMSIADIASNHRDIQGVKLPDWENRYYLGYADASLQRRLESMEVMAYLHYDYKNFSLPNVQLNTPYMHTNGSHIEEKYHWEPSASSEQQKLGDFRAGVKLNNEKAEEAHVRYNAGIEVEDFTISLPDVTELRFQLYGDIATQIEGYDCGLSTSVSGLNYSYTGREDTDLELYPRLQNGLQATLAPYIKIQKDSLRMRIGVRADYIGGTKPHFSIAPDFHATYTLSGGRRQFYGNVVGGIKRESQRQLMSRIPFYIPYQQYKNPWDLIDATIGYRDYSWGDFNGEAFIGIKYTQDALVPIAYSLFDRTVVTLDNHNDLSFELGGKLH